MEDQDKTSLPADQNPSTPATGSETSVTAPAQTPPTPNYYSSAPVSETNAWAIVSLVASILSWVGLFGLGGIVGVIAGIVARNQIRESSGRQSGDGIAIAGIVLGGVNIVLSCIGLACLLALLAGMFTIPFMDMRFR